MGLFDKFKKKEEVKLKKESKKVEFEKKERTETKKKKDIDTKETKKKGVVKKEEKPREVVKAKVKLQSLAYRILIKPVISEKASVLSEAGKYVFVVAKSAKKEEVKRAICDVYGIKALGVNFINIGGKERRYGKFLGRTSDFKKAIVTLPEGKAIQIHEGV